MLPPWGPVRDNRRRTDMSLNGVNLTTLTPAELALELESTSQTGAAGHEALSSTLTNAFTQMVSRMGLSSSQQTSLVDTFRSALSDKGGTSSQLSPQAQAVLDSAFRNGGLAGSTQQMTDAMTK